MSPKSVSPVRRCARAISSIGLQRLLPGRKHIAQHIGDLKRGGYWRHQGPFRPEHA